MGTKLDHSTSARSGNLSERLKSPFDASKGMKFHFTSNDDEIPSQLVTHGRIIDIVSAVSGLDVVYANRNTLGIEHFIQLQAHLDFVKNNNSTGPRNREQVLRVLLADGAFEYPRHIFDKEAVTQNHLFDLGSLLDAYDNDSVIRQSRGTGGLIDPLKPKKEAYAKLRKQSLICVRKRMFVSKTGALGLAPDAIQPGDEVAILNGSRVPLALRKSPGNGRRTTYRLIGQAYFEGAMDGEKVTWSNDGEADEIVLV